MFLLTQKLKAEPHRYLVLFYARSFRIFASTSSVCQSSRILCYMIFAFFAPRTISITAIPISEILRI